MPTLSEYTNVYNSALFVLKEKGFRCWYDEAAQLYACEREGWDFMAESPVGLLGLVALYEHVAPSEYREYWWRQDSAGMHESLPKTAPTFVSVMQSPPRGKP